MLPLHQPVHVCERCWDSLENFIQLLQKSPLEREARQLQNTIQRPGDLFYIPNLLAHANITLNTGTPTILSRWNAVIITTNQQFMIQALYEYFFGVHCGSWCETFHTKSLSAKRDWMFSPKIGPSEIKEKLQKHGKFWDTYWPGLWSTLSIEGPAILRRWTDVRLFKQRNFALCVCPNEHTR